MANIVNTYCSTMVTITTDIIKNYERNTENIKRIEDELNDIMHEVELSKPKDLYHGWIMYKTIRDLRIERRRCKEENELMKDMYEYFKSPLPFSTFERWCIAAIYGGGLGNMIDRVRLGYVIDMIKTDFMVFPVFNVADCFITCGCFAMIFSLLFINKAFWKDDKK